MSPDGLAMIVRISPCRRSTAATTATASSASAAGASATPAPATATDAIAQQVALPRAERLELLDRRIRLLLFVLDRALAFRDLRLQHGGELLDARGARIALQHGIEELHRLLIVLRGLRERVHHGEPDAIVVAALPP